MIKISESAQSHFITLLSKQAPETGLRVFVNNPATFHAECGVSYCPKENIAEQDLEIKFDNFSVYIDEVSAPYLEAAEIDFIIDEMGSQLTLKAPNAKMKKVADDAPLIEQVDYYIQSKINPQLAAHGGHISLIELTDDGDVIIQFGGGCNGCSMVDHTLKEGIEKELLETFPLLNRVKDVTEHERGQHSFY